VPSGTTSRPMPSPAITASRYVLAIRLPPLCGGRLERIAARCHCERKRSNLLPALPNPMGLLRRYAPGNDRERAQRYLFMFQMSVESHHWPPILRQTTTYLPVTCSGGCGFVLNAKVPTSRAAPGPSDCTSTVISLASPSCFTAPPQNFSMALCPFAISAPAGST